MEFIGSLLKTNSRKEPIILCIAKFELGAVRSNIVLVCFGIVLSLCWNCINFLFQFLQTTSFKVSVVTEMSLSIS